MSAADEEALVGLADAVAESLASDAPVAVGFPPLAFATAVSADGRLLRIVTEHDGGFSLHITGRSLPLRFDRFQAGALRSAFAELPTEASSYLFARGAGRAA